MATPPVFLPGKSRGWRSLVGYSPWSHKESNTTERLNFFFCIHKFMLLAYLLFFMCKTILASKYPSCFHCMDLVSRVGDFPHSEDWNARFLEYACIQIL